MVKEFIFMVVLLLAGPALQAKQVSGETAGKVATHFFTERIQSSYMTEPVSVRITGTSVCEKDGIAVYYIFNLSPAGYVIVAADDAVVPVLAYSLTENYSANNTPPQFAAWVKQYTDQIAWAISQKATATPEIASIWKSYTTDPSSPVTRHPSRVTSYPSRVTPEVTPLITSNWNQNSPYNGACPPDGMGPGGHTYAGCVPVCMGQLMYYYRWPDTGQGSYTYSNPPYGTLTADFGSTTYKWDGMTNSITTENPEIAKLLFHLGVSCDLQYGPDGSGMYNHKAAYSLRTYFKYSPETRYVYRDSTSMNWDSILVAHLDRKMPMYYAGWSVPNINGHAFVCDGYQYDSIVQQYYFHFNFGWSGSNNGYFYTSNLIVGGNNFNLAQEVIINAYPDTIHYNYPVYCQGDKTLSSPMGSFSDGGGPMKNYSPDSDCSWLIAPQTAEDSVSSITLNIGKFHTSPADYMTVYDGPNEQSPVLMHYAGGDTTPAITSTGNKMLITFKANGGPAEPGWFCTYSASAPVYCSGITTITADTAVVSDGSSPFNYHNNSNCRWKLFSASGQPLTIHFRRFDTEAGKDVLTIYDLTTGSTLAAISGNYEGTLPDSVTAPGGKMLLYFMTNSSVTGKGWEIYYPISHVGLPETGSLQRVSVYPNPATDNLTIRFDGGKVESLRYELLTMTGTLVSAGQVMKENPQQTLSISSLTSGIYFLRLISAEETSTRKIVVH